MFMQQSSQSDKVRLKIKDISPYIYRQWIHIYMVSLLKKKVKILDLRLFYPRVCKHVIAVYSENKLQHYATAYRNHKSAGEKLGLFRFCTFFTYFFQQIQATPAMSTSRISILPLMSKWFFIPNIFSLYFFAFQLRLCRKRLTRSNRYLEVIFHALDVFSIIFASVYVEVLNRRSHGRHIVCFGYGHVLAEVRTSSKQQ